MAEHQLEYRSVIKFLTLEGASAKAIHDRMVRVYGPDAPSLATVYNWRNEVKRGRKSLEDEPVPGRPKSSTTDDMLQKLEMLVMGNRRLKVSELAEEMGLPKSTIHLALTEKLGMKKVSARWVPKLLSPLQKQDRVNICDENLDLYNDNPRLLSTLITGDETWVYYYDPETKQQSMQWKHVESPPPKKAKVTKSVKKLLLTVFWDCKGPLLIKFHPRNTTVNGAGYCETLRELRDALETKRGVKKKYWATILHDNASPHTCYVARAALADLKFKCLSHPPYSPDLAPSDYYLFRHLKSAVKGLRFSNDNELTDAVMEFFDSKDEKFYSDGIMCLNSKWETCVLSQGDYIEKQ